MNLSKDFELLPNIDTVSCMFTDISTGSTTAYRMIVEIEAWPVFPEENNLWLAPA